MKGLRRFLGVLVLAYSFYGSLFEATPRLFDEWVHAAEFRRATDARIVKVHCWVFDGFIANNCRIDIVTDDGRALTLKDDRFGRAPGDYPILLERASVPPTYSTTVSLATISNRLVTVATFDFFAFVCAIGGLIMIFRPRRRKFPRTR